MIKLTDYFAPLNIYTIPMYLGLLFFFDIFGSFVKKLLTKNEKAKRQTRILNWLIGLGTFIFMWFVLRFFFPPTGQSLFVSISVLLAVSLPNYIKEQKYKEIFSELWRRKVVFLLVAPLLPALFVKASLPPYYSDEMAYHFISPSALQTIGTWSFQGGLYANVPRLMNLFYTITFSITKTYSIARLTNFTILLTSMIYSYAILKRNLGFWSGFLFVFIFFSLPQSIIFTSTLGYVDVPAYAFLLIGLMSALDYLLSKNRPMLLVSLIFWSLALGTKYTPITAIASFGLVYLGTLFAKREYYKKLLNIKFLFRLVLVFLLFGGYWYVKNYIVYGNPIYPFLFACKGQYAADCIRGSGFFGNWTLPITLKNLYPILQALLPKNKILQLSLVAIPVLQLINKNKKTRIITVVLLASLAGELLGLSKFSGFLIRYQQHMQFFLIAALVVQLANKYESKDFYTVQRGIFLIIAVSVFASYLYVVRETNSLKFLNWQEINYSIGRADIYKWIDWKFPKMKETILWCENTPDGKRISLARFDPDLIWYEYSGKMRSFITNCYYKNPPLYSETAETVMDVAVGKKLSFWISSSDKCLPENEVKKSRKNEDDEKFRLRKLNNEIVCNSKEVLPYLYHFDYKDHL